MRQKVVVDRLFHDPMWRSLNEERHRVISSNQSVVIGSYYFTENWFPVNLIEVLIDIISIQIKRFG